MCGNTLSVFQEDPQDMPGQGLARTDNYKAGPTINEYNDLMSLATDPKIQQSVLDLEARYKPQYVAQDQANLTQGYTGVRNMLRESDPAAAQLNDALLNQAVNELLNGGNLSPEQTRAVQQNTRAAYAARGMNASNAATGAEILNQYGLSEQMKANRRAFAMAALGSNSQNFVQPSLVYGRGVASAVPSLVSPQSSLELLRQIYGENQANNRLQSQLETQIGIDEATKINDWGKMGAGAAMGGGGGGTNGGMGGPQFGSTYSGYGGQSYMSMPNSYGGGMSVPYGRGGY